MELDDEELKAGYEENIRFMIKDLDITVEQLRSSELPVHVPGAGKPAPGSYINGEMKTPSGKFELYSELIASHPEWGLEPLPIYSDPMDEADPEKYPYILCSGGRIPNALHSRLHGVPWLRHMRPEPAADISVEDAARLGLREGDEIELYTERGSILVKANPTHRVAEGTIYFYHGYSEADANKLMSRDHVDPYSGFPAYNSTHCGLRKKEESVR